MKSIIVIVCLTVIAFLFIGCETHVEPQARSEQEGLTCPINAELKATLDQYFKDNPVTPRDEFWKRGIVLKKTRVYTKGMKVAFKLYYEPGLLKDFHGSTKSDLLDLNTQIGADIWVHDSGNDVVVWGTEVEIIAEQAVCIPDSIIIKSESID